MPLSRERFRDLLAFEERGHSVQSVSVEQRDGYVLERLQLRIGDAEVRGLVTRPAKPGRYPAILYGHSHGGVYHIGADELLIGREYLLEPLGPVLARAGYVTLAIDMPTFGARSTETESSASKARLWFGRSLIGDMISDHAAALTCLASRADVDPARIGAFGMSMGCTLSFWLAALDERIASVAHLCCFADYRTLVELGKHDNHGIYLMVPAMLGETDCGEIAGLVAPRPQLICIGETDELTPPLAVARAWADTSAAYAAAADRLVLLREPNTMHQETRRMRDEVLSFFARTLG